MGIGTEGDTSNVEWENERTDAPDLVRSLLHTTSDGVMQTSFGRMVSFKSGKVILCEDHRLKARRL